MTANPYKEAGKPTDSPIVLSERRTQKQRKQEAEAAIVRAAVGIVAEKGLSGLTLAAAGEAAGYSRGIVSHHFGKKDDLFIAIVNHITKSFSQDLSVDARIPPGLPMIKQVVVRYLDAVADNSIYARALQLILTEAVNNPLLKPALEKINQRSAKGLANHIRHGIEDGSIRPEVDADSQAIILLATLRGIMGQRLVSDNQINIPVVREQLLKNIEQALQN